MKRILFIFITTLCSGAFLSAQSPSGKAYPNGIYIFCGREIPRTFSYLVEKKDAGGNWVQAAELRAPQNAAALKANLLNLPACFRSTMPLPFDQSDFLYTQQSKSFTTDSLSVYAYDPKILAAIGCGWFDDGLAPNQTCQYRISRVTRAGTVVLGEVSQRFPENNYRGSLEILQFTPGDDVITLYYGLSDTTATHNLRLYRGRFLENNYREVPSSTGYSSLDGRRVAVVHDESVSKGMAYSYVAIPYDYLGNPGTPSDTVNVYNLTKMADIGFASNFSAVADKGKGGVTLKWNIKSDLYVQSYELYRSKDYDTDYERIAALPAGTSTYFDGDVDPAEAYFYFVVMNNGFGNSLPSARVPVILEGSLPNILPPQDLVASLRGNVVELTFQSIEPDIRSYQIFRGEGYTGELSLIASIHAEDSSGSFTDTLALSVNPQTYTYAVADVNSSNSISPMSDRVSIQYSGGRLPIPSRVQAQLRDNGILVIWDDVAQQNAFVVGYNVLRSTVDNAGKTIEEPQIVATTLFSQNAYTDTLLIPGTHYRYVVESVGIDDEKSSQSLHVGVIVPQKLPLPPGQVSAIAGSDRITLRWDNPIDPDIKNVRIYRATLNAKAALLKELPANQESFEDRTAKKGIHYFYYVVTVNNRGEESKPDEPVSARVR